MTKKKLFPWIRRSIQILFFILIALGAVSHTLGEQGIVLPFVEGASLHALCPFGGVVTLWQFVTTGRIVRQIQESAIVLLGITMVLAVLFGPVFCGWICPFGSFQEWISALGKKVLGKKFNTLLPAKIDRWLRYLRYGVLAWAVYMTAMTGALVFKPVDPYYALFNFWTGEVALTGFIALALTVGLSLIMERPFCKYACPMGAVLGLSNLFRIFGLRREKASCIDCKLCDRACPMNIQVSGKGRILDHQCISCGECTSDRVCPVERTVDWTLIGTTLKASTDAAKIEGGKE